MSEIKISINGDFVNTFMYSPVSGTKDPPIPLAAFNLSERIFLLVSVKEYGEFICKCSGYPGNMICCNATRDVSSFEGGTSFNLNGKIIKYYKSNPKKVFIVEGDEEMEVVYVEYQIEGR